MSWFSTDMEWTRIYHLFNRTYIYKWWISQPATVCVSSINFRFHVTLRAVIIFSLQELDRTSIIPPKSMWKHCFLWGWGGRNTGAQHTKQHIAKQHSSPLVATVSLRCERHAESCCDIGSTVTKWWLGKGRILDRQFEQWKSMLFGCWGFKYIYIYTHISYTYIIWTFTLASAILNYVIWNKYFSKNTQTYIRNLKFVVRYIYIIYLGDVFFPIFSPTVRLGSHRSLGKYPWRLLASVKLHLLTWLTRVNMGLTRPY